MDCNLPGSSVHGIFQAIVLEWAAISFSRGSSWPWDPTWVSCIVDRRFTIWATRDVRPRVRPWKKSKSVSCFPCGSAGKESSCNAGGLDPCVGKIHRKRERLPTPVFWSEEFHGLYSPWGCKESDTTVTFTVSRSVMSDSLGLHRL